MDTYMDFTIAIGESGLAIYGKYSANLVESNATIWTLATCQHWRK